MSNPFPARRCARLLMGAALVGAAVPLGAQSRLAPDPAGARWRTNAGVSRESREHVAPPVWPVSTADRAGPEECTGACAKWGPWIVALEGAILGAAIGAAVEVDKRGTATFRTVGRGAGVGAAVGGGIGLAFGFALHALYTRRAPGPDDGVEGASLAMTVGGRVLPIRLGSSAR